MVLRGHERNTRDFDILVPALPEALTEACLREGLHHDPSRDRLHLGGVTVHRYWLPLEFVDLSLAFAVQLGHTPHHAEVHRRAQEIQFKGRTLHLPTVEDLIVMRLLAFRPVDRADAIELVRLYPDLDRAYVDDWTGRLGIIARWADVAEAAEQPC